MKSTVFYYLNVFLRRIHYFLVVFIIISAGAITASRILPSVYLSGATLLVESSLIPNELAASTVQTGALEGLQIIEQRLMSRANLLKIAREQDVFGTEEDMSVDEIVRQMRRNTGVYRTAGRGQATIMTIEFSSGSGSKAAAVVNQYVTQILQENAEIRTDRAGDTLSFFELEVERLGKELAVQGAKILDFKNANTDALPETLEYRLNQQSVLQERLGSAEREISNLKEQRRRLIEIYNATGRIGSQPNANIPPEQQQLAVLQDDLRRALAVYSPDNPKVKLIQAQISQLEEAIAGKAPTDDAQATQPMSILDINLADIDARTDLLIEQKQRVEVQLAALVETIEQTPGNSIVLDSLTRDYDNVQLQYNRAVDRLSKAATGERIELLSKGQRIAILDPATVPDQPSSPNRKMIAAGGTLFGAAAGLALILLLEILNDSIRRPSDIQRQLGITPLGSVPYIHTPMELVMRRATVMAIAALVIIGVPAILLTVHINYLPLDLLYDRLVEKITSVI